MTGGDGTAFSVNCDESTLTTAGGILAVKDHGIGREKLKSRLYGCYHHELPMLAFYFSGQSNTSIPMNTESYTPSLGSSITITSEEPLTIATNIDLGLRVTVSITVDSWNPASNNDYLELRCYKESTLFVLDRFVVLDHEIVSDLTISLSGSCTIGLEDGDSIYFTVYNSSSVSAEMMTGEGNSFICFEEV